ncbi:MAG: Obg family GTPase CgtA, partial [Clostridia bacterium]|nr:Obg family GTPase CgtA [Clostridia bacterium]
HFTTLSPNLGVVSSGENKGFVAADIPGLIEGASDGLGLGHAFLRHVDRCRLLLHVVDISCEEGRNPIQDIQIINEELKKYSPALSQRPQIIVGNKCDAVLLEEEPYVKEFEAYVKSTLHLPLIYVSAATGEGLDELIRLADRTLCTLPPITVYEPEISPEEEAVSAVSGDGEPVTEIKKGENGVYYVEGDWIYRLMGQINFDDYESLNFFQRVLKKRGVFDMLREKGIRDGDTVNLYDFEFEFVN